MRSCQENGFRDEVKLNFQLCLTLGSAHLGTGAGTGKGLFFLSENKPGTRTETWSPSVVEQPNPPSCCSHMPCGSMVRGSRLLVHSMIQLSQLLGSVEIRIG